MPSDRSPAVSPIARAQRHGSITRRDGSMIGVDRRLALALVLVACGHEAASEGGAETEVPPAATTAIEHAHLIDERTLHGVVDTPPDRRASVAAEIPGRIQRVLVREGDTVEVGALLAEIEAGPASDASTSARAHAAEADTLVTTQQASRDHLAHLVDRGIAPRAQLEEADGHLAALQQAATAARATASEARRGVSRTRVTSPLAGVVVRIVRRPGETVDGTPATPIVEVADVTTLEIAATAAARDLLAITRDQSAHVTIDGLAAPLDATVRAVSPALDPVTGTGTVRLALTSPDRPLPLGMAADVVIATGSHDALVVPADAIRSGAGGTTEVLVCEDGAAHPLAVTVGSRANGRAEITSEIDEHASLVARAIGLPDDAACGGEP
jgi:RND family efflux transporter MFP subunit